MSDWTETSPLRVVTGYQNIARKFFSKHGFEHVVLLSADGALEAAPLMGSADIILDLVSTGKLRYSCMMLHSEQSGPDVVQHFSRPALQATARAPLPAGSWPHCAGPLAQIGLAACLHC